MQKYEYYEEEIIMKKKVLVWTLAACMTGTLAACSAPATEETTVAETTKGAEADTTAAQADGNKETEAAGGVLTMATNAEFPPYEYHDG